MRKKITLYSQLIPCFFESNDHLVKIFFPFFFYCYVKFSPMQRLLKFFIFLVFSGQVFSGEFRIIKLNPKMGLFGAANQVLGHLALYEERSCAEVIGLSVDFGDSGLYYDSLHGSNWWNYYFEPIDLCRQDSCKFKDSFQRKCYGGLKKRRSLTHLKAAELAKKYIHVRPEIMEKVDRFVESHFRDYFIIGVHYRGTDKKTEARRVGYKEMINAVIEQIPLEEPYRIFVATDETSFLNVICEQFPGDVVATEACRTAGEVGVHFLEGDHYKLGEEALMDSLLLSRCDLLIRTSSNLSLWSTYFNPELPVILLNQNYNKKNVEPE